MRGPLKGHRWRRHRRCAPPPYAVSAPCPGERGRLQASRSRGCYVCSRQSAAKSGGAEDCSALGEAGAARAIQRAPTVLQAVRRCRARRKVRRSRGLPCARR